MGLLCLISMTLPAFNPLSSDLVCLADPYLKIILLDPLRLDLHDRSLRSDFHHTADTLTPLRSRDPAIDLVDC